MSEILNDFPKAAILFANNTDARYNASISGISIEFTYLDGSTKAESAQNLRVRAGEEYTIFSQAKCVRAIGLVAVAVRVGNKVDIVQTRGKSASEGKCTATDKFVIGAAAAISEDFIQNNSTIFDLLEIRNTGTDT